MSSQHDTLPSTVPKLDTLGSNWLVYQLRFTKAVRAKGKWGHFDRSVYHPQAVDVTVGAVGGGAAQGGAAAGGQAGPGGAQPGGAADDDDEEPEDEPEDPEVALALAQAKWDADEDIAMYLLSQRIPDSSLIKLERYGTCAERWSALITEFTQKSVFAQTAL